jgi:hypothetical protein
MTKAGFTIAGEQHPICPVMLGDARLASQFADKMLCKIYRPILLLGLISLFSSGRNLCDRV